MVLYNLNLLQHLVIKQRLAGRVPGKTSRISMVVSPVLGIDRGLQFIESRQKQLGGKMLPTVSKWILKIFNLQICKASLQTSGHCLIAPMVIPELHAELIDYYITKNG